MTTPFIGCDAATILSRIRSAAEPVTGRALTVRVGEEVDGFRNVGVELPPGGRSSLETLRILIHLADALEAAGIASAPYARGPGVDGDLRGSVQVREAEASAETLQAARAAAPVRDRRRRRSPISNGVLAMTAKAGTRL